MKEYPALKVQQWLKEWNDISFDPDQRRREPPHHFYLLSLPAGLLKRLTGIHRRSTKGKLNRFQDTGIQRRHDEGRSKEIQTYIRLGYPLSALSERQRDSEDHTDLKKPGWLPTALVLNILRSDDTRMGLSVSKKDLILVKPTKESSIAKIEIPDAALQKKWHPEGLPPIEIIDGQHRLWAFEETSIDDAYEMPAVVFCGLDISWQAYLFWSINIKPKRINASLAFDLYPLLRTEDWLERGEGIAIYQETRAQELTEALWSHQKSPWCERINMLGESGQQTRMVTQAAWIRSLTSTCVKAWEGKRVSIGGLFGSRMGTTDEVLPWTRAQQAAFLIYAGSMLRRRIKESNEEWAVSLRKSDSMKLFPPARDSAFEGQHSLLSTDQGIRGFLHVLNDLCFVMSRKLELADWQEPSSTAATDEEAVDAALASIRKQPVAEFVDGICKRLASYDWRSSAFSELDADERMKKAALRGGGGYKILRSELLAHLVGMKGDVGKAAADAIKRLGYL